MQPNLTSDAIEISDAVLVTDHPAAAEAVVELNSPSGFDLGRKWRVSHLKTSAANGWAHDEGGQRTAVSVIAFSSMYEGNFHAGYRLVVGAHAYYLFRK